MIPDLSAKAIRVLWLGPCHSDQALYGRKAVNQAATQWSRGLLRGLVAHGCVVRVGSHCQDQYWPGGDLWPGRDLDFDAEYLVNAVHYLNVFGLRDATLRCAYRRMVIREITMFRPDIVLTYNLPSYFCATSDILLQHGIKWVPIILDQDDPEPDAWASFRESTSKASGLIFLSYWGYQNYPFQLPSLYLDGGVERWLGDDVLFCQDEKCVVYSGKIDDRYGGVEKLFQIFSLVHGSDCRFVLTGKDPRKKIYKYLRREPRAEYYGFLSDCELHALHAKASVFVNPRPPEVSDNRMTFPSKLLQYLSYGKPVVSTWTDGLAPDYRDLLMVPSRHLIVEYANLIERALSYDMNERLERSRTIKQWILETHTWEKQAARLITWMSDLLFF